MPSRSLMGFNLESYKNIETDSCDIINSEEFFVTIVLSSEKLEKNKINECLLAKKKIENKLFNYKGYKIWLNQSELAIITKTHQLMKKQADFYQKLLVNELDIKSSKISANLKKQVSLLLSELESEQSLFSIIYQIFLYQKLEFHGKVESLINSIVTKDYIESFFLEYHIDLLSDEVNEKIVDMLIEIKEKIKDKQLFESLISSISYGLNENLRDLVIDEFDIPNKLSYVQEKIKSVHYGTRLPFVWSHWIEKFSSTEELSIYLERGKIYKRVSSDPRYLATLISFFPKDKEKRDILISKYVEIKKSENPYLEDLSLRLILNNDFSNELINRKIKFNKPIFIQKRNFYRKLLKQNKAILYSVYNLLKIGDIKKEYLIYALAVKSYGL
jgi:hypothetical protein